MSTATVVLVLTVVVVVSDGSMGNVADATDSDVVSLAFGNDDSTGVGGARSSQKPPAPTAMTDSDTTNNRASPNHTIQSRTR
jgi:hypothetical protein